ncbi:MAG: hypothetical protein OXC68_11535, partial [Aestuariivita sp.]|nr:hypothetical protein [Aestuariivita sp.]
SEKYQNPTVFKEILLKMGKDISSFSTDPKADTQCIRTLRRINSMIKNAKKRRTTKGCGDMSTP